MRTMSQAHAGFAQNLSNCLETKLGLGFNAVRDHVIGRDAKLPGREDKADPAATTSTAMRIPRKGLSDVDVSRSCHATGPIVAKRQSAHSLA